LDIYPFVFNAPQLEEVKLVQETQKKIVYLTQKNPIGSSVKMLVTNHSITESQNL